MLFNHTCLNNVCCIGVCVITVMLVYKEYITRRFDMVELHSTHHANMLYIGQSHIQPAHPIHHICWTEFLTCIVYLARIRHWLYLKLTLLGFFLLGVDCTLWPRAALCMVSALPSSSKVRQTLPSSHRTLSTFPFSHRCSSAPPDPSAIPQSVAQELWQWEGAALRHHWEP